MYCEKAAFFDAQVKAGWASDSYGEDELRKLNLLFNEIDNLKGKNVLEPGCGTGRLTEILSRRVGDKGKIAALDISPAMIEAAKARLNEKEFNNLELFVSQIESFEAEPSSFDLILCHQVFPHLEDKPLCLKRFYKLLVPKGELIIFHFINLEEINDIHRKAGTVVENDMMPENSEMARLFNGAGFTIKFIRNNEDGYFLTATK